MRKILFAIIFSSFFLQSCAQKINLGKVAEAVLGSGGGLTSAEIASGLKEALQVGINKGADQVSVENGYFGNPRIKIPFPEDVQKVETALRRVGLGSEVDKFVLALNRGAEEAAKEAKPIFVSAIRQMTINDALGILKGEQDAATQYLKRTTSNELIAAFMPVVEKALEKTQATKYYTDLATRYNSIPFVQKVDPDLKGYATQKAVEGLFLMIADEEAKIRKDPLARTSDLLKKVFGSV
ncbi:DUF4197 domain-containing protein [Jiulongibacter sediminis]|uniref:DUF4197 domain-containing protein n=1 Tax=Jiulongibacter sediminis TaxID=1605367 RepID=UPI0026ED6007|nr:DUF4197 domain-containing protein [Jiulongibacter sediminis]